MLFQISLKVPHDRVNDICQHFEDQEFDSISSFEDNHAPQSDVMDENGFAVSSVFVVDALTDHPIMHNDIVDMLKDFPYHDLSLSVVDDQDWLKECYSNFPPQIIDPFFIHGSYDDTISVPDDMIGIQIDAATAFGSGEHQTTIGCLTLLNDIHEHHTVSKVLDMGCGSGILGIAAAKLLKKTVIAVDIDAVAVDVAHSNVMQNHVDDHVHVFVSDGFGNEKLLHESPFDLVFANILATPLINMADHMAKLTAENGKIILSGLLSRQKDDVVNAYTNVGFVEEKTVNLDDWCAILLKKAD